jgi:hypothetical protein
MYSGMLQPQVSYRSIHDSTSRSISEMPPGGKKSGDILNTPGGQPDVVVDTHLCAIHWIITASDVITPT